MKRNFRDENLDFNYLYVRNSFIKLSGPCFFVFYELNQIPILCGQKKNRFIKSALYKSKNWFLACRRSHKQLTSINKKCQESRGNYARMFLKI